MRNLKYLSIAIIGLAMSLVALPSRGEADPTPTSIDGGKVISVDEAKALLDKKGAAFFDMRNVMNFGKGHVPSAVAMPYKGVSENKPNFDSSQDKIDMSKLPADKKATLVFYSDGPTGWKSYKAAVIAIKAGYTNVQWMREGLAGWTAKGYSVDR